MQRAISHPVAQRVTPVQRRWPHVPSTESLVGHTYRRECCRFSSRWHRHFKCSTSKCLRWQKRTGIQVGQHRSGLKASGCAPQAPRRQRRRWRTLQPGHQAARVPARRVLLSRAAGKAGEEPRKQAPSARSPAHKCESRRLLHTV